MSKEELKKIIDEALWTDSVIDAIDPQEVAVYTQVGLLPLSRWTLYEQRE